MNYQSRGDSFNTILAHVSYDILSKWSSKEYNRLFAPWTHAHTFFKLLYNKYSLISVQSSALACIFLLFLTNRIIRIIIDMTTTSINR